jgi:hypothetical protein
MIVGSVMPTPCADKQKIMGLTALPVPTTIVSSSDPMIPKAVIRTDHFATGKVMSSAITAHVDRPSPDRREIRRKAAVV